MDIKELRSKSAEELKTTLIDLLQQLFKLRMQKGSNQLTKTHLMSSTRKQIARVRTLITQTNATVVSEKVNAGE